MKGMLKSWRSATALVLAVSMFFGMSGITYAAGTEPIPEPTQKKYVSLGDSMTNGYGLPGYEIEAGTGESKEYYNVNGFLRLVETAYPNLVAQYFNGSTDGNGEVKELWKIAEGLQDGYGAQLATSAMRVEDLRYLLNYDWKNDKAGYAGDAYTQWSFVNDRFDDYVDENVPAALVPGVDNVNNITGTVNRAKLYQEQVKDADVITLGTGNANFGVFLLDRIVNALGIFGDSPEAEVWQVYDALETLELSALTEERKALVKTYYDILTDRLNKEVEERMPSMGEKAEAIVEAIAYTFVSFAINYNELLTDIVGLNENNADIIIVSLMNTMSGFEIEYKGKVIPVDKLVDVVIDVANLYLAAVPAAHQVAENRDVIGGNYADHAMYFAETESVDILMYDFQEAKTAKWVGYETLRARLIESVCETVFGLAADPIKDALGSVELAEGVKLGLELVDVTLADVVAYENGKELVVGDKLPEVLVKLYKDLEKASAEEKPEIEADIRIATAQYLASKEFSCALYLAFEEAVVDSCSDEPLQASAFKKLLTGFDDVFAGIFGALDINKIEVPETAVEDVLDEIMNDKGDEIINKVLTWAEANVETIIELYNSNNAESIETYIEKRVDAIEDKVNELKDLADAKEVEIENKGKDWYNNLTPSELAELIASKFGGVEPSLEEAAEYYLNNVTEGKELKEAAEAELDAAKEAAELELGIDLDVYDTEEIAEFLEDEATEKVLTWAEANEMTIFEAYIKTAEGKELYNGLIAEYAPAYAAEVVAPQLGGLLHDPLHNETLQGLFNLFARCLVGNGIGVHPNADGHKALADAIIEAYETGHTVKAETIETVKNAVMIAAGLVLEYYDEAYAYAYDYAEEAGYINAIVGKLDALKTRLERINVENYPQLSKLSPELRAELQSAINNSIKTIEAIKALVLEADELDAATLKAVKELLGKLGQNLTDIREILTQAGIDAGDQLWIVFTEIIDYFETEVMPEIIDMLTKAVKVGTDYLLEKLGVAYDKFVEVMIKAIPAADKYLYDWFYNNPHEVFCFFDQYGDDMVDFIVEHYEAIGAVIGFVGMTFGQDAVDYVMNNPEAVLKAFVEWYETYGDRALDMIKVYLEHADIHYDLTDKAEEALKDLTDLIKEASEEIFAQLLAGVDPEDIKAAVEELKKLVEEFVEEEILDELEKMLDELKEELEALKDALKEADAALREVLEAKIAEVEALIAKVEAKIAEIEAKLDKLVEAVEALEDAVNALIDAVQNDVANVKDAIEAIQSALEQIAEAVGELKDVIHDINNAIDEVQALVERTLAKIEEVVEALEKIGVDAADVLAKIQEKAEKLVDILEAICEDVEAVKDIARKYLDEVFGILDDIVEEIKMTKEQVEEYLAKLEDVVKELKDKVDYFVNTVIPAIKAEIKELEAQLAELKEELLEASGELKEQIEAAIAAIEKQIAALEEKLAELEAMIEDLIEVIEAIEEAIAKIDELVEKAKGDLSSVIDEIQNVIAKVEDKIEDLEELVESIINTIEDAKEIAEAVVEALKTLAEELEELYENASEETKAAIDAALEAVEAALEEAKSLLEALINGSFDEVKACIKGMIDKIMDIYTGSMSAEYELSEDNYYVALGDTVASEEFFENPYPYLVADEETGLGIDHVNLAQAGLSVTGLLDMLKEEETVAEIEAADLITVGFSVKGIVEHALEIEDADWTVYFGDAAEEINKVVDEAKASLNESGLPSEVVNALTAIVEAFPYALVEYVANYYSVATEIHAINEDALVILVGMYNPFEGVVLDLGGEEFALGEYFDILIDLSNVHLQACALLSENTIFVEAQEVETVAEASGEAIDGVQFIMNLLASDSELLHPSEAGHDYIKEQILGALTLIEPWNGLLGDVNLDGVVDTTDAQAIFMYFMGIEPNPAMIEVRNADINQDGYIDTSDAQEAFNIFMGI